MTAMLSIEKLEFAYGDLQVLWGIDIAVNEGEIVTLVGANGAGKSTTLKNIFDIITEINRQGVTILLVEQNVYQSLRIAHRAYVLETGRVVLSGIGEELLSNEHVKKAFLGM